MNAGSATRVEPPKSHDPTRNIANAALGIGQVSPVTGARVGCPVLAAGRQRDRTAQLPVRYWTVNSFVVAPAFLGKVRARMPSWYFASALA
jgi:hypothetical protein